MVQEATHELLDDVDNFKELDELQCVNFSCSIPAVTGRGFIEVLFSFVSWYILHYSFPSPFIFPPHPFPFHIYIFWNSSNSAASNLYLICLE